VGRGCLLGNGFTAFLRGEAGNLVDGGLPFRGGTAVAAAELVAVDVLFSLPCIDVFALIMDQ
jgi:hypothetical protein